MSGRPPLLPVEERTQLPVGGMVTILALGYGLAMAVAVSTTSYDTWGGAVVAAVLAAIFFPVLTRLARQDPDPWMARIFIGAFVVKQIGSYIRYYAVTEVLGGDAIEYAKAAKVLAPVLRAQDYSSPEWDRYVPDLSGTNSLRLITAIVYNFFGTSFLGGFMVFGALSFIGTYLVFRSYRMAIPEGPHRRFAAMLFLAPTLVFWPSSIGKDAWLVFTIGLTVYGATRMYLLAPGGLILVAAGLAGSGLVRPHITLLLLTSLIIGRVIGRTRRHERGRFRGFVRFVVTAGFLVVAIAFTTARTQDFFDSLGDGSITGALDETQRRSSKGSAEFTPARVTSPTGVPLALATVLFRPFPNEAHNQFAQFTSLEGVVLALMTVASARSLMGLPKLVRRYPLVALALVYSLLFVIAFSAVGNFGILARQRSQLYPLFLILLALPRLPRRPSRRERQAEHDAAADDDGWREDERDELTAAARGGERQ